MWAVVLLTFVCDDCPDVPLHDYPYSCTTQEFTTLKTFSQQGWFLMQKTQTAIKYKLTPSLHYKYLHGGSNLGEVRYFA